MMGLANRILLFTVVFHGFLTNTNSQETIQLHPVHSDFDRALGIYAEGLLLFHHNKAEGMFYLTQAVKTYPHSKKIIDTWCELAEKRILSETDFSSQVSDFTKHQRYIIQCLFPIVKDNPNASYLCFKVVEAAIHLERFNLAKYLATLTIFKKQDPYSAIIELEIARLGSPQIYHNRLREISESSTLKDHFFLQQYLLKSYLKQNLPENKKPLLNLSLRMIRNLPKWPKLKDGKLCQLITDGVIYGSDIGKGAQEQLSDSFYNSPRLREWSTLAAILMKLKHYPEVMVIIENIVLGNAEKKWRAYLTLASCASYLGHTEKRLLYLQKASLLRPDSTSLKKSLAAAYINARKYNAAEKILKGLETDNNLRLLKIKFYIDAALKRYQTAFAKAEKIYNWPDDAAKIAAVTVSFTNWTVGVYQKNGKPQLLIERLKQALRYHPESHQLKNTLAYIMIDNDQNLSEAEDLIRKALDKDPENAAYLDTYAWLKYKQKDYAHAWKLIKKAMDKDENKSAVIILHAGDICLANDGFRAQSKARELWKLALQKKPDLKSEIDKRLKH